ncbi:hypothetical protein ACYZTM_11300 [Pseudomonas sp. MDT2-39-1]
MQKLAHDGCVVDVGGIGNIRDNFLSLHDMTLMVLESLHLAEASRNVDSIWRIGKI